MAGKFLNAVKNRPQFQEAHRLAEDIGYMLKVRVKNAYAYDEFYQAFISEVKVHTVTALIYRRNKKYCPIATRRY